MSTANLAILGVMVLVGMASALELYRAGANRRKPIRLTRTLRKLNLRWRNSRSWTSAVLMLRRLWMNCWILWTRGRRDADCFVVPGTDWVCAATTEGGLSCLASLDGRFPEGDGGRDPGAPAGLSQPHHIGSSDGRIPEKMC